MSINFSVYEDKVRACWLGKNIGGTLGAPLECQRGVYDLQYYIHDLNLGVLPNDDLDLQLIWLNAAEKFGKNINAEILSEYWMSYIVADWSEYGAAKSNLRFGMQPPISGWYNNHNKDSCGAFIRSEIWACLAPGHPEIAVKYAREDAICDHADEGLYGELFCAALQSAAFVEKDMDKLLEIGLSYIPEDCAVAKAVNVALDAYRSGKNWKEARKAVLKATPGTFGMYYGYVDQEPEEDIPVGEPGFDAPSNIGLMMVGWLYGEGDFSKSICIAAGCGEDADCSAGTLAATLGIIYGTKGIDEKWLRPIGDEIKTISLDLTKNSTDTIQIPTTVTELTERIIKLMPTFMNGYFHFDENGGIVIKKNGNMTNTTIRKGTFCRINSRDELCASSMSFIKENVLISVRVEFEKDVHISENKEKIFKLFVENKIRCHQWLNIKIHIPHEWEALPCSEFSMCLDQRHGGSALNETSFSIIPHGLNKGKYNVTLEIESQGRPSVLYVPMMLVVK